MQKVFQAVLFQPTLISNPNPQFSPETQLGNTTREKHFLPKWIVLLFYFVPRGGTTLKYLGIVSLVHESSAHYFFLE